jgi:4-hydroxybenzoate polyprenyltransferase
MLFSRFSSSAGLRGLARSSHLQKSTFSLHLCRSRLNVSDQSRISHKTCQVTSYSHLSSPSSTVQTQAGRHDASILQHEAGLKIASSAVEYEAPTSGFLSYLPASVVPYAELIRIDKPVGTYYLLFPCIFSTLLAAPLASPITPPSTVLATSALFATGALVMRGAGCTINDLWDRKLDPKVARTRLRPIARGAISPGAAVIYTGCQLFTGLAVLLQFPFECFFYATPSLLLVSTYPLAKRVTNYPQAVLGLTFSWGAIMGFPALGVDLLSNHNALTAAACLYGSNIAWTILYDMIYAHQDIKDDAKAGIKSIALRHEKNTKAVLSGLAVVQATLLAAAGAAIGAGPIFYVGTCGGALFTTANMIWRVRLSSVKNCWWWFRRGCWMTGGAITLGLTGEYLAHYLGWYEDESL